MAQQQNGAQHPPATGGDRPLSFYDNLSSSAIVGGAPGRVIQFPDIQFRFDESIPDRRSVHSSAKSDFFGLNPTLASSDPYDATESHRAPQSEQDHSRNAAATHHPPATFDGASVSDSPTSTSSTVAAQSLPVSPRPSQDLGDHDCRDAPADTSTPRSSRPSSTIKTITIKLPDTGSGPSEAVYMTTTVPQNFTKNANTLIGRHKPTRSSLRHSRMLVVNKAVPQRYPRGNSLNLRHVRLSKLLMVLQILIGLALSLVGLAITVWSPSTNTKDNPYWSGMVLILCGSLFLALFEFKRGRTLTTKGVGQQQKSQQAHRWRESCFHFLHVNALVVLLLTIFFTMLAFVYALIHTTNLSSASLRCEPPFPFNANSSTCVCTIDTTATTTAGPSASPGAAHDSNRVSAGGSGSFGNGEEWVPEGVIRLEYRDFNCEEVHGIWYYVTITSTLLNSAGCLLAATFLVIYAVECIRRPESDSQRSLVCVRAPATSAAANGHTDRAITPQDHRITSADASSMPLLLSGADQSLPTIDCLANASIISGGSSRSGSSRTTDQMNAPPAEENTLTTIVSRELNDFEVTSP